jgi:2-polyprenyl-3-methyl-5-hydroxy-6-metoxy-1,4-benzoquinol methylase
MRMSTSTKSASRLHKNVPPDWYFRSIKRNLGQRFWHKTRFKEVEKSIEKVEGKILDIGSADGVFTKIVLDKSGAQKVIGIDVLKSSVEWAKRHWKKDRRLEFRVGNVNKLDFKTNSFDAVFALEVLEHIPHPELALSEIKRVLKRGGHAIFLIPTDNKLFKSIWFFWTKYGPGRIWDDCHLQSYTNDSLEKLSKRVGFKIEENRKFLFNMLQIIKVRK